MVSAAKLGSAARNLNGEPTAQPSKNSTSHTVLHPRLMGADGVAFLCSFQGNEVPVIRAMLERGQIGGGAGQWDRGKVRRNGGRLLCDRQMGNLVHLSSGVYWALGVLWADELHCHSM
jgi:hypothetical protein